MLDIDTTESTFIQLFKPILSRQFFQRLKDLNADKYVKKLKTTQLIELIALAQIRQQRGLREIGNSLNNDDLSEAINLESICGSQISRRLRVLPTKGVQELFSKIVVINKLAFADLHRRPS